MPAPQLRGLASATTMSDSELDVEIRILENSDRSLRRRLERLGDWHENEYYEISIERDRLHRRWNLIAARFRELTEERSARVWRRVDACERELAQAAQRRLANW